MDCSTFKGKCFNLMLLLNRLSIGVYLLLAGVGKITGEGGIPGFVGGPYKAMTPPWLPPTVATPFGYALPILEVVFGLLLEIGLFGRFSAWVVSLLLLSFTVALYHAGMFWHTPPAVPGPYHTNVILITTSLLLAIAGPGCVSVDALFRRKNK